MPIMVKEPESNFTPAPAGAHYAVCCDVVDLGMVDGMYGPKPKVRVVWQLEVAMPDGRPYTASQRYTASLHEMARLRADLESWRGRPFTQDELNGFDLEKLIGANALLNIIHETKDGKTYSNVKAIMPPKGGPGLTVSKDFVRRKDRDDAKPDSTSAAVDDFNAAFPADDDSVPF